jgi:hypothetical protein
LNGRGIGVRCPAGVRDFYLSHNIQTGFGAHPVSCLRGTEDSFPEDKAAEV